MILNCAVFFLNALEKELAPLEEAPGLFLGHQPPEDPEELPLVAFYPEKMEIDSLFKEGPAEERDKQRFSRRQFTASLVLEIIAATGGACERWAAVVLSILQHNAGEWIKGFNSSSRREEAGGDYATRTFIDGLSFTGGTLKTLTAIDRYHLGFQLRGSLEFIRKLSAGTEPINRIEITAGMNGLAEKEKFILP